MESSYLIIILAIYGTFVNLNYIWFKELMDECEDRTFANHFWFYIATGPLLTGFVVYKKIQRYRRKRAIKKAIAEQLPALLKKYNITVEEE